MSKNLIVSTNPAKRSAKQRAASKRNIKKAQAANRGGRGRGRKRRRSNPSAHKGGYKRPAKRRSNPRRRFPTVQGIINDQVIPAAVGGTGAVLNDMIVNLLPLPGEWKAGWMRHVSKAIGAIAIGFLGGMVLPKRTADQLGAGAMTVVGYNVVRDLAAQFMPQLPLGEYLDPTLGVYLDPTLGYYGAGLNPNAMGAIPGSGLEIGGQFTRGSPYVDPAMGSMDAWPTGGGFEDIDTGAF